MKKIFLSLAISLCLLVVSGTMVLACDGKCAHTNCPNHQAEAQNPSQDPPAMAASEKTALDPLCGMMIGESHAVDQVEYQGETYYFCMKDEKEAFLKTPDKYLKGDGSNQ